MRRTQCTDKEESLLRREGTAEDGGGAWQQETTLTRTCAAFLPQPAQATGRQTRETEHAPPSHTPCPKQLQDVDGTQ